MATNGANDPLLAQSENPSHSRANSTRRRLRRSKSAPLSDHIAELDGGSSSANLAAATRKRHPGFKKIIMFTAVYVAVGTLSFYLVRNQISGKKTNPLLDSVYFCIVTMTTVGYGDLTPDSTATKLLASAFVFIGMAIGGLLLTKAADYLVEKQEVLLVKAFHNRHKVGPYEMIKEVETHKLQYKCIVAFVLILFFMFIGTIFLIFAENLDTVDAFYCVCATITTLGYGDVSFSTEWGRVFAIFWILMSCLSLAQFFLYMAELYTQSRQKSMIKLVLSRRMTNFDLEAADLDNDGIVVAAEFVLYKLKEMGKVSQEDIAILMEEFEELDVDQSGSLSMADITLAEISRSGRDILPPEISRSGRDILPPEISRSGKDLLPRESH